MNLPHESINPRIVLGYDNQIKLMVNQVNNEKWTESDFKQLEQCKIEYLEKFLGYKIEKLEKTITHDDYEKNLEETTDFYKKKESQN